MLSYRLLCECLFFPADFPDRSDSITLTDALFVHLNGTYSLRRDDINQGGRTPTLTPLKNFPAGIKHVTCNARYALMLVDGRVFRTSKFDTEMGLKHVDDVENIVQLSCRTRIPLC